MKVIDISSKFDTEKPQIKLTDELTITVDNSKNAVLKMQQAMSSDMLNDTDKFDKAMQCVMSKKDYISLEKLCELISFKDYTTVCIAVMAAATGEDFDTMESRFQTGK